MVDATENPAGYRAKRKPRGRPFAPGVSGNPSGRPKGARAAAFAALDDLAVEAAPEVLQALIARALEGDPRAAELVFKRAWPERKGRPITVTLPVMTDAGGLAAGMAAVSTAMGSGDITPDEATAIAAVLDVQRRAIQLDDHEARLKALEEGKL